MASSSDAPRNDPHGTSAVPVWLDLLSAPPGRFVPDSRFGGSEVPGRVDLPEEAVDADGKSLAAAWQAGFTAGEAAAAALLEEERSAQAGLRLAFARLDALASDELRDRLREAVVALCRDTLAPLALDEEALARRCEAAAAALGGASDRLTLHLCSPDIALLDPEFAQNWTIVADERLQRGAFQLVGPDGGIADGPDEWAAVLRAALTDAWPC